MATTKPRKHGPRADGPVAQLARSRGQDGAWPPLSPERDQGGRLRAARVGERQEVITTDAWLDEWLANLSTVIPLPRKQRSG